METPLTGIRLPRKAILTVLALGFLVFTTIRLLPDRLETENVLAPQLSHEFFPFDLLIDLRNEQTFLLGNKIPTHLALFGMESTALDGNKSTWASNFSLVTGGHRLIFIELPPQVDDPDSVVTEISALINGIRCRSSSETDRPGVFRVAVPAGTLKSGENRVEISAPANQLSRPQRLAVVRDPHAAFDSLDWSFPVQAADNNEGLVIHRPGRVILSLVAPPGARAFTCNLGIEGGGLEGTATVRLALDRPLAGPADLTNSPQAPTKKLGPRDLPIEVTLEGGTEYALVVDIESITPDAHLVISRSSFVVDPQSREQTVADSKNPTTAEPTPNSSRPDVIVIILDAARVDHFEPFGYDRATTPFLASLADESLLFSNTYAQAPYTTCSVPTIISGLSFATHNTVGKGHHRLSDLETTLAEHFSDSGYQTIGISSTPKHSTATGASQGYDEFHEVWGTVKALVLDPAPVVNQATDCLRSSDKYRPLFMMLHILPPHSPYLPPAEHDIFRRSSTNWGDTEQRKFIQSVEDGEYVPLQDEIDELVALYNGNLHWADEAVKTIVNLVQETRNWRNTLLVLVSDHGEAFMEHGRLQHSSTLYDEMLRVPLMLRLPEGAQPEWVDTKGLVSLEDLTPTLLGVIGKESGPRATGRNLLLREPSTSRDKVIFRTVGTPPDYGLLAGRWKAIVHPNGTRELYDLETDPTETHDLSLEQPTRTAMLALILARELNTAPLPFEKAEAPALSEDEIKFLHRLGYVE